MPPLPRLFPITNVGSMPRPFYLGVPSWFDKDLHSKGGQAGYTTQLLDEYLKQTTEEERNKRIAAATNEVVKDQEFLGADILTDGEMRRENYIHYHCRHLTGFDFDHLKKKAARTGNYEFDAPNVVGKVEAKESFLTEDWREAQKLTTRPVKVTLPGPMTIGDTVANTYYPGLKELCEDLSIAINVEVMRLCEAGVKFIQIDEPLFARKVKEAHDYGFRCLERSLRGVENFDTHVTVHICCGYSNLANEEGHKKAPHHAYALLAEGLEAISNIHCLSLEDARERLPDEVFQKLKRVQVQLGVVESCFDSVRSAEEIQKRVEEIVALGFPTDRLLLSPDCGMAMFSRDVCAKKMENMRVARDCLATKFDKCCHGGGSKETCHDLDKDEAKQMAA